MYLDIITERPRCREDEGELRKYKKWVGNQ